MNSESSDFKPEDTTPEIIGKEAEAERQAENVPEKTLAEIEAETAKIREETKAAREAKEESDAILRREEAVRGAFTFSDSTQFKRLLKLLNDTVADEATFTLNSEGLHLIQMDAARVSMVILSIARDEFETFECFKPGKFALNTGQLLKKGFKNVYKNEKVSFAIGYLKATFMLQSSLNRTFPTYILDIDTSETPVPKIVFTSKAKVTMEGLRTVLRDVSDGNALEIKTGPDSILFQEHGDDAENPIHVAMKTGDAHLLTIEGPGARGLYSSIYLKAIAEALAPLTDLVTISHGDDMPLKLEPMIQHVKFEWYMAPRIETS